MPVKNYGVLKGKVEKGQREDGVPSPHYQILVNGSGTKFRIAVNVKSQLSPSELLYLVVEDYKHPFVSRLALLREGFTSVQSRPEGNAVDFIRGNLFKRTDMRLLPPSLPGPDNDLNDVMEYFAGRAMRETGAMVYAFGAKWGPEPQKDKIFGFSPGNGIHDIHMNQGNDEKHRQDDGVWQDGALFFHFPQRNQWSAIFLAFQSQAWHTDDVTGHRLPEIPAPGPGPEPAPTEPDHAVRIVAAMVNPPGPEPERESVTLLNASPASIDLTGWKLLDRQEKSQELTGVLAPGECRQVPLAGLKLGNKGGIVTLIDSRGLKVDGVAYTAEQGRNEGWTVVF